MARVNDYGGVRLSAPWCVVMPRGAVAFRIVDRYELAVFLSEANRQATHAELAASDLDQAVENDDSDRLWYSVHSLLIALANLSKLMWPAGDGSRARGLTLRALLGVPDDSPLKTRRFRNHWEHFDARLDKWARKARKPPPNESIGPLSRFPNRNLFLKQYDPKTRKLGFRGQSFELTPVLKAVSRIRQLAYVYGNEAAAGTLNAEKVARAVKARKSPN